MPLSIANQRIVSPISGIGYRLMSGSESWRISRSAPAGDVVTLIHLKGTEGVGIVAAEVLAGFVAGTSDSFVEVAITAPCGAAFRNVLLADFVATSDQLMVTAIRARDAYHGGLPGLRPRSPAMRQRFEVAYSALYDAWKAMAVTWEDAFGRENAENLPDWMTAAWECKGERWDRKAALEVLLGP